MVYNGEPRYAGVRPSEYDAENDADGRYRGNLGIELASAIVLRDDRRLTFNSSEVSGLSGRLDELSDPKVCEIFVERVEKEGLSKKVTLDIARKVDAVKARLPKYYSKHEGDFAYNTIGLEQVGRAFRGVLVRARNTVKKSRDFK